MTLETLTRAGLAVGVLLLAQAVGAWRAARAKRHALETPLFDAAALEAALHPRAGDDAGRLAELKELFSRRNRLAQAGELSELSAEVAALDGPRAGPNARATLRRAVPRLLASGDPWLQRAGAGAASALGLTEAVPQLENLLARGVGDARVRADLEAALARLGG